MTQGVTQNVGSFVQLYQNGSVNAAFVAGELGISERHAYRLLSRLPGGARRQSPNRLGDEIVRYVREMREENPGRNCQWIAELASDRFGRGISQPSVWRILKKAGLMEARPQERVARSRFEAKESGDLVQMDTTWGYWWKGQKLCLILLLDDHSRYILHWKWVEHDSAEANMAAIRETVQKYGVFRTLYTDNASFFKTIRHDKSRHQAHAQEEYETEIGRSCRELGILHLTHKPYQPQGKGKVERLFRFIQDRFVSVVQDDQSLEWPDFLTLFEAWVRWYNGSHVNRTTGETPKKRFNPKGFTPLSGQKCLDDIFCWHDTRKVDACNQFSYQGELYTIPSQKCMVAYRVTLHAMPGKHVRVWHGNEFVCELPYQEKRK